MAITSAATLPLAIKEVWDTKALLTAQQNLFQNRWARPGMLPQNIGKTYKWYRMNNFSAVTSALTPGVTPQAQTPSETEVSATVSWYGAHVLHDEDIQYTTYHPVVNYFSERLGYQCGISVNDLTRTEQASGFTTVVRPGTYTADSDITANDVMDFSLFAKALQQLQANDALPVEGQSYTCIMHPSVYWDFVQDDQVQNAFREAAQAEGKNPYRTGFYGEIGGCRIYVSSRALVTADAGAGNVDIYSTMFFGSTSDVAQAA